jgi:hypothetical protein
MSTDETVDEQLFAAARDGLSPSAGDIDRMRDRVRAAIAAGAATTVATASKTGVAAVATKVQVVAAITVTLAVVGAVAYWVLPTHEKVTTRRDAGVLVSPPRVEIAPTTLEIAPAVIDAAVAEVVRPAPERRVVLPPPPVERDAPVHDAAVANVTTPALSTLADELALVRSADAALHAGDPTTAIAIVRGAHVTQLAAELAAIEIDALCALHQGEEAGELARTFMTRFPHSTLGDRVKHSCTGSR